MAPDRSELVNRIFDAFARRDVDAAIKWADPSIEFVAVTGGLAGHQDPYRGHGGLRQYFRDVARVWEEIDPRPDRIIERGDETVVLGRIWAHGRDGSTIDSSAGWILRQRGEKIVSARIYSSASEALAAAGLLEDEPSAKSLRRSRG